MDSTVHFHRLGSYSLGVPSINPMGGIVVSLDFPDASCIYSSLGMWTLTLDIVIFPLDHEERLEMTVSASGYE